MDSSFCYWSLWHPCLNKVLLYKKSLSVNTLIITQTDDFNWLLANGQVFLQDCFSSIDQDVKIYLDGNFQFWCYRRNSWQKIPGSGESSLFKALTKVIKLVFSIHMGRKVIRTIRPLRSTGFDKRFKMYLYKRSLSRSSHTETQNTSGLFLLGFRVSNVIAFTIRRRWTSKRTAFPSTCFRHLGVTWPSYMNCASTNSAVYRGFDSLPILLDHPDTSLHALQICDFFMTDLHIFLFLWINTIYVEVIF